LIFESQSVEQTEQIAADLASKLNGGECIALYGDMGAGKTQFVRGLLRGLGGNANSVSSPTFVLLNVYDSGRVKVFHLDAYRIYGAEDFEAIGFAEFLEQRGVVVVEWAARVERLLPTDRMNVKIDTSGKTSRRIEVHRSAEK
jgi:tRNA threonylcarbamoyladenosine biosynthesis protein TsaE